MPAKYLFDAAEATALSTELNSLADAADSALSAAITNAGNTHMMVHLNWTPALAPAAGSSCIVFIAPSIDNTTFADAPGSPAGIIPVGTTATAQDLQEWDIPIPPGNFKVALGDRTGVAFPATGSTLKYRLYSIDPAAA